MGHRSRLVRGIIGLVCVGMFATACGGGDDTTEGSTSLPGSSTSPGSSPTTSGGGTDDSRVITVGQYSAPAGLDPAKNRSTGSTGAMELAAIYDTLMRYDPAADEFVGSTAASLTPNADASLWTLELKPGITFEDGTAYDAAAVKFSLDREMAEGDGSVRTPMVTLIASIDVTGPLTVQFTLVKGWSGLPYLLSGVAGMVYSQAALEQAGDDFNSAASGAGAGPFRVKSYKPGESLDLVRNPDYHGGTVHLAGIKFVPMPDNATTLEAVKSGSIDAGFTIDAKVFNEAKDAGLGSVSALAMANTSLTMNPGVSVTCKGGKPEAWCSGQTDGAVVQTTSPTSDLRVRQAVAAAVDPEVINQRVYDGQAAPNTAPFFGMKNAPDTPGPAYDLDKAKSLVEAAKADGWDGKIRILAPNTPTGLAVVQAVAAQLQLAGMDPVQETTLDQASVIQRVLVQRDWDIVQWGYALLEDFGSLYPQMIASFGSAAKLYGYGTAEMDAAIDLLRTATTDAEKTAALEAVSSVWTADLPAQVITAVPQALLLSPELQGVVRSAYMIPLFSGASIAS